MSSTTIRKIKPLQVTLTGGNAKAVRAFARALGVSSTSAASILLTAGELATGHTPAAKQTQLEDAARLLGLPLDAARAMRDVAAKAAWINPANEKGLHDNAGDMGLTPSSLINEILRFALPRLADGRLKLASCDGEEGAK